MARAERTSTLEKGSSSKRILGSLSSARASDNLCRMPWEYCATGRARVGIEIYGGHAGGASLIVVDPVQTGEVTQVLHAAHFVIEQRRMGHVAELMAYRAEGCGAENLDAATSRLHQSGEDAQECGLSGAVVAEDGVEPSRSEFGVDAAQRGKAAELLDHGGDGDYGGDVHVIVKIVEGEGEVEGGRESSFV